MDSYAGRPEWHLDKAQCCRDRPANLGVPVRSLFAGSAGVMAVARRDPSSPALTPLPGQPTTSLDDLSPGERLGPGNWPAAAPRALPLAFPLVLIPPLQDNINLVSAGPRELATSRSEKLDSVCARPWCGGRSCVSQSERVPGGKRQDMAPGTLPASPRSLGPARPRAILLLTRPWTCPPVSTHSVILDIP